jgi:hypothetical protein
MRGRSRGVKVASALGLAGLLAVAGFVPAAAGSAGPMSGSTASVDATQRLIVRLAGDAATGTGADAALEPRLESALRNIVAATGGRVVATQPALGMAVVEGPAPLES